MTDAAAIALVLRSAEEGSHWPDAWQCRCGWLVDDVCYTGIVFDAPCPRCGRPYSTFSQRKAAQSRKP